jgi:hypothetical protein
VVGDGVVERESEKRKMGEKRPYIATSSPISEEPHFFEVALFQLPGRGEGQKL